MRPVLAAVLVTKTNDVEYGGGDFLSSVLSFHGYWVQGDIHGRFS